MSFSGDPASAGPHAYAVPPAYAAPPPRRAGRRGPPLWLGVLVLLAGPAAYLVALFLVIGPALSGAAEGVTAHGRGKAFPVRGDSDYIVVSPQRPASCTVRLPDGSKVALSHGVRENHPVRFDGQVYYPIGYFDPVEDGRAKITCSDRVPLATMRWEGDVGQMVAIARYGGYAAGAAVLLGIVMIVLRRRRPAW
ncbi:hypothetical protein [Nocardioides sp.]|uniref:hypothetical protein n=1 Tax=Nocardioides sp. TaxID=35761 RepID=UPI0035282225